MAPDHVTVRAALDPIGLFVIAIILLNILAPIFKTLRAAARGENRQTDADARRRLSQALSQSRPSDTSQQPDPASAAAARRAAEIARLRRALLASAGIPETDSTSQSQQYTVSSQPLTVSAYAVTTQPTPPPPQPAPKVAASPISPSAALPSGWDLELPGTLMTLEPASASFEPIATAAAGGVGRQFARPAASLPSSLTILQGPQSGTNLFVAAAIVGPCAAFRHLGHTPGGW